MAGCSVHETFTCDLDPLVLRREGQNNVYNVNYVSPETTIQNITCLHEEKKSTREVSLQLVT